MACVLHYFLTILFFSIRLGNIAMSWYIWLFIYLILSVGVAMTVGLFLGGIPLADRDRDSKGNKAGNFP